MKKIVVAAGIIKYNEKILCVQRGQSKLNYISEKWEFPGGKTENNESLEQTVKREIHEELKMNIRVNEKYLVVEHLYPDFHLTMHSFLCSSETDLLELSEHISYKWLDNSELHKLDWAAADLPIVEKLQYDI